jgi:hypothetical protein
MKGDTLLTQSERMHIQVKIMECKALAALSEDDPTVKAVWDAQAQLWESFLKPK